MAEMSDAAARLNAAAVAPPASVGALRQRAGARRRRRRGAIAAVAAAVVIVAVAAVVALQLTNQGGGRTVVSVSGVGQPGGVDIVSPAQAAVLLPTTTVIAPAVPGARTVHGWLSDPNTIINTSGDFAVSQDWTTATPSATSPQVGATVARFPDSADASAWVHGYTPPSGGAPVAAVTVPGSLPAAFKAFTFVPEGSVPRTYQAVFAEGPLAFDIVTSTSVTSPAQQGVFAEVVRRWLAQLHNPPPIPPATTNALIPVAAADTAAAALLDHVVTPEGSRTVPGIPGSPFSVPAALPECYPLIDQTRYWSIPGTPGQVDQYLRSHPAPGMTSLTTGQGTTQGVFSYEIFEDPPVASPAFTSQQLTLSIAASGTGTTGLRADAQIVPVGGGCDHPGVPSGA